MDCTLQPIRTTLNLDNPSRHIVDFIEEWDKEKQKTVENSKFNLEKAVQNLPEQEPAIVITIE